MNKQLIKLYADRLYGELKTTEIEDDPSSLLDVLSTLPSNEFARLQQNKTFQRLIWCLAFDREIEPPASEDVTRVEASINVNSEMRKPTLDAPRDEESIENTNPPPRLPDPSTLLSLVQITPDMDRFVKQLYNHTCDQSSSIKLSEKEPRLQEILDLSEDQVQKIPNVGQGKVDQWKILKKWYEHNQQWSAERSPVVTLGEVETNPLPSGVTDTEEMLQFASEILDIDKVNLDRLSLERTERQTLNQFEHQHGCRTLAEILRFKRAAGWNHTIENIRVTSIERLQHTLSADLEALIGKKKLALANGITNNVRSKHLYIDPEIPVVNSASELDSILVSDIDDFLETLSERKTGVIKARWGYKTKSITLEEVGENIGVTRERVRQIQTSINRNFKSRMRLSEGTIWQVIEEEKRFRLPESMPKLFDLFSTEKEFFNFIEMVTGNKIPTMAKAGVTENLLDNMFIEAGAPLTKDEIKKRLLATEACELPEVEVENIDNIVSYLEQRQAVRVTDIGVSPTQLSKNEAAACVLSRYPEGLAWLEICKLVNENTLCKTPLSLERKDNQAFADSDLIYLSGQRLHGHLKYVDFDEIDLDAIFTVVGNYIRQDDRDVIHLHEIYQSKNDLHEYDYYIVRYMVKMFGEDSGIYFQGKSRTDSVSLQKGFEHVSQIDVILNKLRSAGEPMSRKEVADILMSKSTSHASLYLTGLVKDGRVVQIEDNRFTVPELVFNNVTTDVYAEFIDKLLETSRLPADITWLTRRIDEEFNESNSPAFYASIIRMHTQKKQWFMARGLVSLSPLPYTSLADALEKLCDPQKSWEVNEANLSEHINVEAVAAYTLYSQLQSQREKHESEERDGNYLGRESSGVKDQ